MAKNRKNRTEEKEIQYRGANSSTQDVDKNKMENKQQDNQTK